MAFSLPRLKFDLAIVDPSTGKPTRAFTSFINEQVLNPIEAALRQNEQALAELAEVVLALQAVAEQAQAAQQAANENGGGTSAYGTASLVSNAWVTGALVSLTGVVAGDLTISGSGPIQNSGTSRPASGTSTGRFRIVEVVGMVDTVVFTGDFSVYSPDPSEPPTTYNMSAAAVAAFSSARTSTGAVDYRLDVIIDSGEDISNLRTYLYVKRA
jgi:hypothetical protein